MPSQTVYTKTAKGVLEIKNKTVRLPRELGLVFLAVDGKSAVADLAEKTGTPEQKLLGVLETLVADGYIKVFSSPAPPVSAASSQNVNLDLDFTSPEAIAKLNIEAEARTRAETEARARAQAAARAAAEARVRQEAQARARARAEAKMQAEAEAKVRAEAAVQAASEARTQAEAEAKAAADAKARAKAEARVHAAMEAKARAEAEARLRTEAEARAREEAEAKAAGEVQAREETEARMRAEVEARAYAEAETKARVAVEAQMQAMTEALVRAEARAREEAEAALRQREIEETRAKAQLRDLQEQSQRARQEAEARVETERKSRDEAIRKAREEAERKARTEVEALIEAERKARAEAEDRAKAETVARIMQEQQMREKADEEVEQRVAAELRAHELAVRDADARYRSEAEERARAAAAEQQSRRDEEAARSAPASTHAGKPARRIKIAVIGLIVLLAAAAGLLPVVPLTVFIPRTQELVAQRLQQPVTISNMRYALLPSPQLTLEGVSIGKLQEIKIDNIVVNAGPLALLGEQKNIDSAEVNSVTMEQDMLAQILLWARPGPAAQPPQIARLRIRSIRLPPVKAFEIPAFGADITLGRDGALQKAVLSSDKLTLEIAPQNQLWQMKVTARGWQLPLGPALEFDDLAFTAIVGKQQAAISGIEGHTGRGIVKGAAKASWGDSIRLEGDFSLVNGDLGQLLMKFTRNFEATGTLNVTATYALQGTSLATLFGTPRVDANFAIAKGALNNIDIVRAIQSPSRDGIRGGKTSFDDLAGSLQLAGNRYLYRQLRSTSEAMNATGNVEVSPDGELSGHISAELGSKSLVVARGGMNVAGDLQAPVLKP